MSTRSPSFARSAAINLAGTIFPLVVAVVAIPVTVRALGPEQFGLLAFAWVIFAYSTILDLGVSRAVTRYAAEAIVADDSQRISEIAWNALVANSALGFLGALLFLALGPILTAALNVPANLAASALQGMFVLAAAIPVTLVMTTFRALLEANHRFDLVNLVAAPSSALLYLISAVAAHAGFDVPFILLLILVTRIGSSAAFAFLCQSVFPSLRVRRVDGRALRELLAYGGWVTVSGIAGTIFAYTDRILVAFFRGVGALTYYAVPYEIVARVWLIPTAISTVLFPAFSAMDNHSPRAPRHLYGQAMIVLLFVVAAVVVALMLMAGELLTLWVGTEIAERSAPILRILVIGVGVNSLAFVPFALLQGVGRPDLTGKVHGLSLGPFLVVGVVLAEALGPIGVAVAFTVRLATEAALLFLSASRVAPTVSSVMATSSVRMSVAAVMLTVLGGVSLAVLDTPLVVRASFVLLTVTVALAGIWRLGLEPEQRETALQIVPRAIQHGLRRR
jgi:O-antigen/teichoic acid export membrane protein